jgi:hypothetical protein
LQREPAARRGAAAARSLLRAADAADATAAAAAAITPKVLAATLSEATFDSAKLASWSAVIIDGVLKGLIALACVPWRPPLAAAQRCPGSAATASARPLLPPPPAAACLPAGGHTST